MCLSRDPTTNLSPDVGQHCSSEKTIKRWVLGFSNSRRWEQKGWLQRHWPTFVSRRRAELRQRQNNLPCSLFCNKEGRGPFLLINPSIYLSLLFTATHPWKLPLPYLSKGNSEQVPSSDPHKEKFYKAFLSVPDKQKTTHSTTNPKPTSQLIENSVDRMTK